MVGEQDCRQCGDGYPHHETDHCDGDWILADRPHLSGRKLRLIEYFSVEDGNRRTAILTRYPTIQAIDRVNPGVPTGELANSTVPGYDRG